MDHKESVETDEWIFFRAKEQDVYCEKCGEAELIAFPLSVKDLCKKANTFKRSHKKCGWRNLDHLL